MKRAFFSVILFLSVMAFGSRTELKLSAGEVVFEQGIEYSNPDDQHLQLNLARPNDRKETERSPAVLCIHGGGFRAGKRER